MFAAFGESLRIRDGRIDVPGGEIGRAAWEAVVGEKLDRPERFAQRLFEDDRGRLAYLLDVLSHADGSFTSAVFASPNNDGLKRWPRWRAARFPNGKPRRRRSYRPPSDLGAFVARLRASAGEDSSAPDLGTSDFWQRVFDEPAGVSNSTDVVWLAETSSSIPCASGSGASRFSASLNASLERRPEAMRL